MARVGGGAGKGRGRGEMGGTEGKRVTWSGTSGTVMTRGVAGFRLGRSGVQNEAQRKKARHAVAATMRHAPIGGGVPKVRKSGGGTIPAHNPCTGLYPYRTHLLASDASLFACLDKLQPLCPIVFPQVHSSKAAWPLFPCIYEHFCRAPL